MMYDENSDELFAGARSRNIWLRGLLMLVFLAILWFIRLIVLILAAFQFVYAIVTGGPNRRLLPFCRSVATYMRQMVGFVTWTTETRPYPFSPWPVDGEESTDDSMAYDDDTSSASWDEPYESDTAYDAPAPKSTADEPPVEPVADEPSAAPERKPRASGTKAKKKKKSSRPKAAS